LDISTVNEQRCGLARKGYENAVNIVKPFGILSIKRKKETGCCT